MVARPMLIPPLDRRRTEALRSRGVAILGATGSIGRSALDVVRAAPQLFRVVSVAAGRSEIELGRIVEEFSPRCAVLVNGWSKERKQLPRTEYLSGAEALCVAATSEDVDVVLAAVVGMAGLAPTVAALRAGKLVALANKESLVMAGELVRELCAETGGSIVPVDSEHSALFQALQGSSMAEVSSLVLTASGGPFLTTPVQDLRSITPAQALKHPRWNMGAKISIDSATMVNKALEVVEAAWLFGVSPERIRVVVHPQSVVHSAVEFVDGSMVAQLGVPDMKGPIAYALAYPGPRLANVVRPLSLTDYGRLDFMELDELKFPAVRLAKATVTAGGAMSSVFSVSNEVAVGAFLEGRLPFLRIVPMIEEALSQFSGSSYRDLDDLQRLSGEVARWVSTRCS